MLDFYNNRVTFDINFYLNLDCPIRYSIVNQLSYIFYGPFQWCLQINDHPGTGFFTLFSCCCSRHIITPLIAPHNIHYIRVYMPIHCGPSLSVGKTKRLRPVVYSFSFSLPDVLRYVRRPAHAVLYEPARTC